MLYVNPVKNESGAYTNLMGQYTTGYIALDTDQVNIFLQYNGFVDIDVYTVDGDLYATSVTPNIELFEAWKSAEAENPKPGNDPTVVDRIAALESAMLTMMMGG